MPCFNAEYNNLSILSWNIFGSSSAILGNLRKFVQKCWYDLQTTFGKSLEILKEMVGNLRKIVKNFVIRQVHVCFQNKQYLINTWLLGDMKFLFSCIRWLTHEGFLIAWTLKEKVHISALVMVTESYVKLTALMTPNSWYISSKYDSCLKIKTKENVSIKMISW